MGLNNLKFVRKTVECLNSHGLEVWVAGGWAEELRGTRKPSSHGDLDLFVLAQDFSGVESALSRTPEWEEIKEKRFSHKRAWCVDQIMVECILVTPDLSTCFFDGRLVVRWPSDTLTEEPLRVAGLQVISTTALALHRYRIPEIAQARRSWLAAQVT